MATVILARHGRTAANASGILAGRAPGTRLDDVGVRQAQEASARLHEVRLAAAVTSPMERCQETLGLLLHDHPSGLTATVDQGVAEVDYGTWTGQPIKTLLSEPLWKVIQAQPSAAVFPQGEGLADMSARVSQAIRRRDAEIEAEHGPDAVWLLCSHGDPIKAALADALGMHLDQFQRLVVDPASLSVIRYTPKRNFVTALNTRHGSLAHLNPPPTKPDGDRSDAVVGGGAGHP